MSNERMNAIKNAKFFQDSPPSKKARNFLARRWTWVLSSIQNTISGGPISSGAQAAPERTHTR